jgi:hypothetical protein
MSILAIVIDGVALMIGSLLGAVMCIILAWWIAQRLHHVWVAPLLLLAMVAAMLATRLERSLFVRMVSVFEVIGMAFLVWIAQDTSEPETGDRPPL